MKRIVLYILSYVGILYLLCTCYIKQPAEIKHATPMPITVSVDTIKLQAPKDIGRFYCTSYCSCSICCGSYNDNRNGIIIGARGVELIPDYSVAVDPRIIPLGTIIIIDGKEYRADDTGSAIKGNHIDFYCASHEEALSNPNKYVEVYLK